MGFSYSGKIEKLSKFYKSMCKLNIQIGTFEHSYNKVTSDVIFDTRDIEQWNLLFIKRGTGETLSIPLNKGYLFTIEGNEKYSEFIMYFGFKRSFVTSFKICIRADVVNHISLYLCF